jgi:hypothetical protein
MLNPSGKKSLRYDLDLLGLTEPGGSVFCRQVLQERPEEGGERKG